MPIMEYECPSCSHSFELYQVREDEETKGGCPRCGNGEVSPKGPASQRIEEDGLSYFRKDRRRVSFG